MASVEINGGYYVVAEDSKSQKAMLLQTYVNRLSTPFRNQGIQVRDDDQSVNRYTYPSFPLGIGWARARRDTGRGVGGLLDSTCWTALGPTTLGKLQETQTHADPAEHFRKALVFKGDLWGFFEEDFSASEITDVMSRKFGASSDDWTGGSTMNVHGDNAFGNRIWDAAVHKSSMFALTVVVDDEIVYQILSNATGSGTWFTAASGTGWPDAATTNDFITTTRTRRNNFDDDVGRLLSFGNILLAAIYLDPDSADGDGTIRVLSTTDSGVNWATDVNIPSGNGPKAFVDWYDLSATRAPVLITAEGVYSIDISNNTFELIYELDGDPANGRYASVGNDGALYVGLGSGQILRLDIFRSTSGSTGLDVINIGPPGDGLVTTRTGHVNYILRTPTKWLIVGYGGHASSRDASIFMIDTSVLLTDPETGEKFMPWHHMWQDATGDLDIVAMAYSTEDDATARLHWAMEGSAASILYHIEEPFVHPDQSSTVKYQDDSISFVRFPVDDLGDPQTIATILQAFVDADDLSATTSGEYIQEQFGVDGAADTDVTLGNYLSGTKSLSFGSGVGVAGKTIARRLNFFRSATATNTPKLHESELQAHHVLLDKLAYTITIDIQATADDYSENVTADLIDTEVVITALETIAQSTTLVTFTTGRQAQTKVKVPNDRPPVWELSIEDSQGQDTGYRTGFITLILEEGI